MTKTKSGSSVKKEIEEVAEELHRKYSAASRKLGQYEQTIEQLSSEREDILLRLAKTYLPELDADDIQGTLREVQAEVHEIFRKKQEKREELASAMESSEQKRASLQDKVDELAAQLNEKVARRDELSAKAGAVLENDNTYKSLAERANALIACLEKDERTLGLTSLDFKRKSTAILQNRFFKYLQDRNYNPEQPRRFTGRFDPWIAQAVAYDDGKKRVVGFAELKKVYDYLVRMPKLMKEDYEERAAQLTSLEDEVNTAEKAASDKVGLTPIFEEIEKLLAKKKEAESQIGDEGKAYRKYAAEMSSMENTKDQYHSEALQRLKTFLKGEKIADLKERARATPGTEDDQLVDKIEEIDTEIRTLKNDAKISRKNAEDISRQYESVRGILSTFDSNDYDSSRSYFSPGFDVNAYLLGFISGQYTMNQVLGHIESNHHLKPVQSYSSYNGPSYGGASKTTWGSSHRSSSGGFGGGIKIGGGGFGGGARIGGRGF